MQIESSDFDFIRQLVRRHSAIVVEEGGEKLAGLRLAGIVTASGLSSVSELVSTLRNQAFGTLHRAVVEAMATSETRFFRDMHPFDALRKTLIPQLIERRRDERTLSIWCGACSTGQEPYSVAMLLREHFSQLSAWKITILGTDLVHRVLEKAESGIYTSLEVNRGLPATYLIKYFASQGINWHLLPEIRQMVEFREMNLAGAWPPMPRMDIILLRNVLASLEPEVKAKILEKTHGVLRQDGYLFLGNAETTLGIDCAYERYPAGEAVAYRPLSAAVCDGG